MDIEDMVLMSIIVNSMLSDIDTEDEPKWKSYDGQVSSISKLEDTHVMNIIKYCFASNKIPSASVLLEAQRRGFLPLIADEIQPRKGYQSPEELCGYAKRSASTVY